jgi:hypothetical protein
VGVFWHVAQRKGWVLSGSWNFTGGASSYQWNVLAEMQNNPLAMAYSNEMRELLSGRFHAHPDKSHAHDGTRFRLQGTTRDGWVRFAPYPSSAKGGSNALTDVVACIDAAQGEIVFALNKLTRLEVAEAMVRACNRGVEVHGTIPKSDREFSSDDSYDVYQALVDPGRYATANRVWMYDAFASSARIGYDEGSSDLTHAKYMAIDPYGSEPMVVHGSANWTWSALESESSNDENVLFLPHAQMARAFAAQFNAMTDGMVPACGSSSGGSSASVRLHCWLPAPGSYEVLAAPQPGGVGAWTQRVHVFSGGRGIESVLVPSPQARQFFRLRRVAADP